MIHDLTGQMSGAVTIEKNQSSLLFGLLLKSGNDHVQR